MDQNILLHNKTGKDLYEKNKDLPIVDYHCHLSPREIYEDKPFNTITDVWLGGDHYKWRLMRASGIEERYITGRPTAAEDKALLDRRKFQAYAGALEMAAGNPLYVWSHMELSRYFGIDEALTSENADKIYDKANDCIQNTGMSPRKLIESSHVQLIATTDAPSSTLEWHKKIKDDNSFSTRVVPSFRPDNVLNLWACDPSGRNVYARNIRTLADAAGQPIRDLDDLKQVLADRIDFFSKAGCGVSDVGIEMFPKYDGDTSADKTFKKALDGDKISRSAFRGFLFELYIFLAGEYRKHNITMQLHMNAKRNASSTLLGTLGPDVGGDGIASSYPVEDLIELLDACEKAGNLPRTIVYSNNPDCYEAYVAACGSFPHVQMGAAWWFNDHERGIIELMDRYSENSTIAGFCGMLTDSRSFLSYARHDYFRRIFASWLGAKLEDGTFLSEDKAQKLIEKVYYQNARDLFSK